MDAATPDPRSSSVPAEPSPAVVPAERSRRAVPVEPPPSTVPVEPSPAVVPVEASPSAAPAAAAPRDRRLWADLLRRTRRAQDLRHRLVSGPGGVLDRAVAAELAGTDDDNAAWLADLVADRGWPGRSVVGEEGAMAAWLLAQHADAVPERQEALLDALGRAVAAGDASPAQLAYLEDRVRVNRRRPQRYGTQTLVTADGVRRLHPVEDPDGLDARRAAAGLPPLTDPR